MDSVGSTSVLYKTGRPFTHEGHMTQSQRHVCHEREDKGETHVGPQWVRHWNCRAKKVCFGENEEKLSPQKFQEKNLIN